MTDRHEPGTTAERIAHLEALRVQSEHLDPKAEERQRARGKGLARERIEALFDPGTFREIDRYAQHRNAGRAPALLRPARAGRDSPALVTSHDPHHHSALARRRMRRQ